MKKKILIIVLAALVSAGGVAGVVVYTRRKNVGDTSSSRSESVSDSSSEHVHAFTLQNTDLEYLKSEATCTAKAVYYYSCECGERGTQTFEYGTAKGQTVGDHRNEKSK